MKWAKRLEKEVVMSDATGLHFDFKETEYVQISPPDESFFRRKGHEVIDSDEYPGKATKAAPAPKKVEKEKPKVEKKKGDK